MSPTLSIVQEKIARFKNGQIDVTSMWTEIDDFLTKAISGEDQGDPFADDKVERRTMPTR